MKGTNYQGYTINGDKLIPYLAAPFADTSTKTWIQVIVKDSPENKL